MERFGSECIALSLANEQAPPLPPNGIDAHRATLQDISSPLEDPPQQADLAGTDPDSSSSNQKSKINNPQSAINPSSSFQWPERLPEQVTLIRKLLTNTPPDAEALSAHFGRKNQKRTEQIEGILETLTGLGQL